MLKLKNYLSPSKNIAGVRLSGIKSAALAPLAALNNPKKVVIPLYYRGQLLSPEIRIGDAVKRGQCLGQSDDPHVPPVHSSISGKVVSVESVAIPSVVGMKTPAVVIENDYQDHCLFLEKLSLTDPPDQLFKRVCEAGVAGMGGGGFSAAKKVALDRPVNVLIINGAECEPEISCDDLLMQHHATEVLQGAQVVMRILGIQNCLIGIEDDKPNAIKKMRNVVHNLSGFGVEVVPTIYPGGSERQLIEKLTGLEVPARGLPADVGVVCFNVATLKSIADAVLLGEPLVDRIVTIAGEGIEKPQNRWVRLGTVFGDLMGEDNQKSGEYQVVMGGPMMGFCVGNDQHNPMQMPVLKITNCILLQRHVDITQMPCIRCGDCVAVCPMHLLPQQLYWLAKSDVFDRLGHYNLFDCIECGACSYVCPSKIPLVHYYRYAKEAIRLEAASKKQADIARTRHEKRKARLEKEKQMQEQRLAKRREQMKKKASGDDQTIIQAALNRVKDKNNSSPS